MGSGCAGQATSTTETARPTTKAGQTNPFRDQVKAYITTTKGRYTYKSQPVRYPVTPFDPTVLLYIAGGVLILALIYYPIHWYK